MHNIVNRSNLGFSIHPMQSWIVCCW